MNRFGSHNSPEHTSKSKRYQRPESEAQERIRRRSESVWVGVGRPVAPLVLGHGWIAYTCLRVSERLRVPTTFHHVFKTFPGVLISYPPKKLSPDNFGRKGWAGTPGLFSFPTNLHPLDDVPTWRYFDLHTRVGKSSTAAVALKHRHL